MKGLNTAVFSGFARTLLAGGFLLVLVACGEQSGVDSFGALASAAPSDATAAVSTHTASAATNPLCAMTPFAEISTVAGGHFDKIDVIDEPDLHYLECVYLDSSDLYAGLTIRFVSTDKLVGTSSKWQTAAAYFDEWGRGGASVTKLGERAAWIDLPAGLLVLQGDHALHFSASRLDPSDPPVRARIEMLARAVVARLP